MNIRHSFTKYKHVLFGLFFLAASLGPTVAPLFTSSSDTQKTYAAGNETYSWSPNTDSPGGGYHTITATGGTFGNTSLKFLYPVEPLPQPQYEFVPDLNQPSSDTTFTFRYGGIFSCKVDMTHHIGLGETTIVVAPGSPNKGTIQFPRYASNLTEPDASSCYHSKLSWDALYSYFNGATVSISGTAPFRTDSGALGHVEVEVRALPTNPSKKTIAINVKKGSADTLEARLALPTIATSDANLSPVNDQYYGPANFNLPPGDYTACTDWGTGKGCVSFNKKNEPLQIEIYNALRGINRGGQVGLCTTAPIAVGPYQIAVEDAAGTQLIIGQTESKTTGPLPDGGGDGRPCVRLGYSLQSEDPAVVKAINEKIDAGIETFFYKTCITAINVCKPGLADFLYFDLTAEQTTALLSGGTAGENKPSCEDSDDTLAWAGCGIFNGIANSTDFLFDKFIQPFLYTAPISTNAQDDSFKIWSTFRVYGDIFLVIALLVIVFGESIGGGLVDAYTAKKALPRVLAAAILVNLSVYIVAFLVDITNVLGATIGNIITAPIDLSFKPDPSIGNTAFFGGIIGLIFSVGGIATVLTGIFTLKFAFIKAALWVAFFALLPIFFAILTLFLILIIRKGIILALILISPVAFALYCLPATEKYFRKWWDLLFKTLLIYPAIVVVYAVADVLSVTIMRANGATADSVKNGSVFTSGLDPLVAPFANMFGVHLSGFADTPGASTGQILLAFLSGVVIEGVFKTYGPIKVVQNIGAATAALHGAITKGGGVVRKMLGKKQEGAQKRFGTAKTQAQAQASRVVNDFGSRRGIVGRTLAKRLSRSIQGGKYGDALAAEAAQNAQTLKEMQAINDTGDDTQTRALTVDKKSALERDLNGGTHWRRQADGTRQFRTLGGKWVNEADVDAAKARWGGNQAAFQWSLGHEMEKASTAEEHDYMRNNFKDVAKGAGYTNNQIAGAWTGAAFSKQNVNREWKHYNWNGSNGDLSFNRLSMARELDETKSPYELGQLRAESWTTMTQSAMLARERHDRLTAESRTRTLTQTEQGQLRDDKEFLGRAARSAGNLEASGMLYGASGQPQQGGAPPPPGAPNDAAIGQGAIARTREEQVRFVRTMRAILPPESQYTGNGPTMDSLPPAAPPNRAPGAPNAAPGVAAAGSPYESIEEYGDLPTTEDAIDRRTTAGRGRNP